MPLLSARGGDGPERSWQRNLRLVRKVLSDTEHGEIWDFEAGR